MSWGPTEGQQTKFCLCKFMQSKHMFRSGSFHGSRAALRFFRVDSSLLRILGGSSILSANGLVPDAKTVKFRKAPTSWPTQAMDQIAGATNTSLHHLPDELLRRIFLLAHQNQIVVIILDHHSTNTPQRMVTYSLPPCLSVYLHVSKRIAGLAKHVPNRLLRIHSTRVLQTPDKTVRLLRTIRCPVQIMDFSEALQGADWSATVDFLSHFPYPEQVQTLRIIHHTHSRCSGGPVSQCPLLQNLIDIVEQRMLHCNLLVKSERM